MILGRNFSPVSSQTSVNADSTLIAFKGYFKVVYIAWWSKWESDVHPKLFIPDPKWNKRYNNVKIGDIGILLSSKAPAGKMVSVYKCWKVVRVLESEDGLVRRVIVEYRIPSLKEKQVCVDIRRLVILPNISI